MSDVGTTGSNLMNHIHRQFVVGNFDALYGNLNHSDHFGIHNELGKIYGQALFQNAGSKHDIPARQSTQGSAEGKFIPGLNIWHLAVGSTTADIAGQTIVLGQLGYGGVDHAVFG